MGNLAIGALRVVIVIALAGFVFVQTVIAPLLWIDLEGEPATLRVPFVLIFVLGIGTLEVCAVCVWKLLTMVRRGNVFSTAAFRYVNIIIGAIGAASVLMFALAVTFAPGEDVAPGIVLMIFGASLVIGGVALLVYVMRTLLAQATSLRTELDEVI